MKQEASEKARERRLCYKCGKTGHVFKNCRASKAESVGHPFHSKESGTHKVNSVSGGQDSMSYQFSNDETEAVKVVQVPDHGSCPQRAEVVIQGYPAIGIVDSSADITTMNGDLFKRVAAAAHLKKDFKKADKVARTYDRQSFLLDGLMDMDISFDGQAMRTPVYLKMNAHDPLLLSEGVCCQLGILKYHPDGKPQGETGLKKSCLESTTEAVIPIVQVQLIKSTKILPQQSTVVSVKVDGCNGRTGPWLPEPGLELGLSGLCMEPSLLQDLQREPWVLVKNTTLFTQ